MSERNSIPAAMAARNAARWIDEAAAALDNWHRLEASVPTFFSAGMLGKPWPTIVAAYIAWLETFRAESHNRALANIETPQQDHDCSTRPGRRGRSDLFYARLVEQFIDALRHEPRTPIRWLVANATPPTPSTPTTATWRTWLAEAERRGLLTDRPAQKEGRTGGTMTDECRQLLTNPSVY